MNYDIEDPLAIAEELNPMMVRFARETSRELPWDPHTADSLHEKGYIVFTARHRGVLAGFCLVRRVKDGATDAGMYLSPEFRLGWTAIRFAQFVERFMGLLGARWMVWECDEESGSKALAEYLDHKCISRRYFVALEAE